VKHNATCLVLSIHSLYFSFLTKKAESNQHPVLIISPFFPFFLKLKIPAKGPIFGKCFFNFLNYLLLPLKQTTSSIPFLAFILHLLLLFLLILLLLLQLSTHYPQFHLLKCLTRYACGVPTLIDSSFFLSFSVLLFEETKGEKGKKFP